LRDFSCCSLSYHRPIFVETVLCSSSDCPLSAEKKWLQHLLRLGTNSWHQQGRPVHCVLSSHFSTTLQPETSTDISWCSPGDDSIHQLNLNLQPFGTAPQVLDGKSVFRLAATLCMRCGSLLILQSEISTQSVPADHISTQNFTLTICCNHPCCSHLILNSLPAPEPSNTCS
jgi:hypothetical protein